VFSVFFAEEKISSLKTSFELKFKPRKLSEEELSRSRIAIKRPRWNILSRFCLGEIVSGTSSDSQTSEAVYTGDLLRQATEALPSSAIEAFQNILASAHLLSTQISNILDASNIDDTYPCLEHFPIQSKIVECVNYHKSLAAEKKVKVELSSLALNLQLVYCDHVKIVQILTNLLTNAIKHSRSFKEVKVEIKLTAILSDSQINQKRIEDFIIYGDLKVLDIRVIDSGFGVEDMAKQHSFHYPSSEKQNTVTKEMKG
jgi:signal transduction histidine kinase